MKKKIKIYFHLALIAILVFFILTCKKEATTNSTISKEAQEIQENYRKKIKPNPAFKDTSKTKEDAVFAFLDGISKGKGDLYACSKEEYTEIFLPNSIDEKTITSFLEPEKAWELTMFRRKTAMSILNDILLNKSFEIKQISWKRNNRKLNFLNSHQIGSIELSVENKSYTLEVIKLVIETNNQFKVCVYAK